MRFRHQPDARARLRGERALAAGLLLCLAAARAEVTLPPGFRHTEIASGLNPVALAFAPDGRLFVAEKHGKVRIIEDDRLLPQAALSLETRTTVESGLVGLAVDPAFDANGHLYVFYKASAPYVHNRLSRFTLAGPEKLVAVPGSEKILVDLPASPKDIHNGGALAFGKDGKLYLAYGEDGRTDSVLTLASLRGKVLRLNPDGSIPADNPFHATATGIHRSIFASGLRNPFSSAVHPVTGRLFVMDVGASAYEEINEVSPGANFGWPRMEGPQGVPPAGPGTYAPPVHAYSRGVGRCISGGAFYAPKRSQFPASYRELFFFGDYFNSWIKTWNPATGEVGDFLKGVLAVDPRPVAIAVGPDGSLYYVSRGQGAHTDAFAEYTLTGKVFKIQFGGPVVLRGPEGAGYRAPSGLWRGPGTAWSAAGRAVHPRFLRYRTRYLTVRPNSVPEASPVRLTPMRSN